MIARIAIFILLATAAIAGDHPQAPAKYDHPYQGQLIIVHVAASHVAKDCRDDRNTAGCAYLGEGYCLIYVAMKADWITPEEIIRHETWHCNGWPADHPD